MERVSLAHRWSDDYRCIQKKNFKSATLSSYGNLVKEVGEEVNDIRFKNNNMIGDFISRILLFLLMLINNAVAVFADPMSGLSDIYQSDAFVGNTKWLEKFDWVGVIVQKFITVFGLLIAVIVIFQIIITVIYFANKELWDSVATTKEQDKGLISYTFGGAFNGGFKGSASKGSDIIMNYVMLCLPNIKKYSEAGSANADPNWTLTTWFMSTFISKCILLLVVSMTINGSLMQGFMMVVDGMGVVAQTIVETDLEGFVQNKIDRLGGENYSFALGSTGIGFDECQGDIATKLYRAFLKNMSDVTTDSRIALGSGLESYISKNITKDAVTAVLTPKANYGANPLTDAEWEKVKVNVVANTTKASTNSITVTATDLGFTETNSSNKYYYHIYFDLGSRNSGISMFKTNNSN